MVHFSTPSARHECRGLTDIPGDQRPMINDQPQPGTRTFQLADETDHSHSIVAGGLLLMSYTTRLTPLTSLMMRVEMRASSS